MYLFLLTVIPLYFFLFRELEKKRYAVRGGGFNFFCGAITSAIYCFVGFLAFTTYRLPEFSFMNNFRYFFLYGTVFPASCCVLIYLLIGKNSWSFKMLMLSDVIPAFFSVFLPYRIISTYDIADPFCIFVLPGIVVCCLYILRKITVYVVLTNAKLWKKIVFGIISAAVILLVPAVAETLFFIGAPLWLRCIAEVGAVLVAVGAFFLFKGDAAYVNGRLEEIFKPIDVAVGGESVVPSEKKEKRAKKAKHDENSQNNELSGGTAEKNDTVVDTDVASVAEPELKQPEETVHGTDMMLDKKDEKPGNVSASGENMPKKTGEEKVVEKSEEVSPASKSKKNGKKSSKKKK